MEDSEELLDFDKDGILHLVPIDENSTASHKTHNVICGTFRKECWKININDQLLVCQSVLLSPFVSFLRTFMHKSLDYSRGLVLLIFIDVNN